MDIAQMITKSMSKEIDRSDECNNKIKELVSKYLNSSDLYDPENYYSEENCSQCLKYVTKTYKNEINGQVIKYEQNPCGLYKLFLTLRQHIINHQRKFKVAECDKCLNYLTGLKRLAFNARSNNRQNDNATFLVKSLLEKFDSCAKDSEYFKKYNLSCKIIDDMDSLKKIRKEQLILEYLEEKLKLLPNIIIESDSTILAGDFIKILVDRKKIVDGIINDLKNNFALTDESGYVLHYQGLSAKLTKKIKSMERKLYWYPKIKKISKKTEDNHTTINENS